MFYQFGSFISTGAFTLGTAAACVILAGMLYLLLRPMPNFEETVPAGEKVTE